MCNEAMVQSCGIRSHPFISARRMSHELHDKDIQGKIEN